MINIPDLLENNLKNNPELLSNVRITLERFEPWLEQSGMPFFPGFTDHSPRHINDVLKTASALISDDSHALLSPEDVAVLIIAILLHDCGMHLTQDGFRALIENDAPSTVIEGLKDVPWKKLWVEFLAESRRFGEDRLLAIFGDTVPITSELDTKNLTERDCLLIGEFVRRNHARLAHEIAITGVPTVGKNPLQIQGIEKDFRDLAGLVARSHGMSIRSTFPYITSKYHRISEYRSVKAPYLMAIIRIADYVQVQSERAIKTLLSVKELRSPFSRQEWRNHFAVSDVTMRHEDPEAMYVHAKPVDVKTFIKLERLFKDIQRELDASWATVGEVYGRLGELSQLGLTIRRIRSNIDSRESFASTVSYVPIEAGFKTSGPDLLKLLVGPLYDYKYNVGIRELVQNAVDACRELIDIQIHQNKSHIPPSILVEIQESDDGSGWVTVTDTGVGMTLETVTKYFLIAGASFRNSDVWKKQHTNAEGQSRVLRGGRFGVGALAAFLIGDEISVRTRYFDRDELTGIEFSAQMDDPIVELRRCPAPAGTSIKVRVANPEAMKSIRPFIYLREEKDTVDLRDWESVDWFTQAEPAIEYIWSGTTEIADKKKIKIKARFSPQKNLTPTKSEKSEKWIAIEEPNPYEAILWCYPGSNKEEREEDSYQTREREVVVNGLRVSQFHHYDPQGVLSIPEESGIVWTSPAFAIQRPSLAIFDPAGNCPINLQRSAVSFERMNKDTLIAKSVLGDYVRKIQKILPTELTVDSILKFLDGVSQLPGIIYPGSQLPPIFATTKGFFVATEQFISELDIKNIYFIRSNSLKKLDANIKNLIKEDDCICFTKSAQSSNEILTWFRVFFATQSSNMYRTLDAGFPNVPHTSESAICANSHWEQASAKGKIHKNIINRITALPQEKHILLESGNEQQGKLLSARVENIHAALGGDADVFGWHLSKSSKHLTEPSLIAKTWVDVNKEIILKKSPEQ